ncbi:MAG: family 78 glycoside hydrolase catalytic domain [Mucilaginibacter sp.]|uniref:family 78 glycoside hydrolase catalytic domain n=1 Tax=Mucilaginibacter sp. TaxID=1882438 RepID=UPI0031B02FA9
MSNNKYFINTTKVIILIITLLGNASLYAQNTSTNNRWGKNAHISKTSLTLDGVKPIASWIWDSGPENPQNYYLLVRKTFNLDKVPLNAIAFISAYAYADVYINGKLFERCPMNCDPEYQCYDKFDIAGYLQKGANCITAVVQNFGVGLHSQMNARGGFFLQAKLNFPGRSVNLLSDSSWKVTHAKAWNTQTAFRDTNARLIGFIEEFDARLWPKNWQSAMFNDAAWENAKIIGVPPVAPWNQLTVIERPRLSRSMIKPVRQWKSGNKMVYDFGVEIVGYPRFTINSRKEGIKFEIGTGERLDTNRAPLLRVSSDHSEKYTTIKGVQSWRPYTWSGFRYFSIETNTNIDIQSVTAEFACYNYEMQSSFACSDAQLNKFWEIGRHTMRINSIDTYEDPWREHTQYIAGDSRYMQIFGNYAFGKSSRLLSAYNIISGAQSQRWRSDGAVRSRYPTDYFLQPGSSAYLADYQLEWMLMMYEYFLYYGNDELIEQLYPNLKKAMDYYKPFLDTKTGLLANLPGWIVLDWPSTYPIEQKSMITGTNCLYYGALNAAANIANDFGHDPQQAEQWKKEAAELKNNINKRLWSEKDQAYLDSYGGTRVAQQSQVYALEYGLADDSRKKGMIELIKKSGKASEQSFAYRVLKVMLSEGNEQWAMDYMRKNWGAQTRLASFNGAWQEGWDLPWGSTSHAWSSGPTALLTEKLLGIEPAGYGWKTFIVKPTVSDLTWAKGKVSTVSGDISASWKKTAGNHFFLKLSVPKGTKGRVYLPTSKQQSITINGKPPAKKSTYQMYAAGNNWYVITISAGTYQFECEINHAI